MKKTQFKIEFHITKHWWMTYIIDAEDELDAVIQLIPLYKSFQLPNPQEIRMTASP